MNCTRTQDGKNKMSWKDQMFPKSMDESFHSKFQMLLIYCPSTMPMIPSFKYEVRMGVFS